MLKNNLEEQNLSSNAMDHNAPLSLKFIPRFGGVPDQSRLPNPS